MTIPYEYRAKLKRLTVAEKLQLMEELWDSIAADPQSLPAPQWQKDELHRRWAMYQNDPHGGRSWEEVEAEILRGS